MEIDLEKKLGGEGKAYGTRCEPVRIHPPEIDSGICFGCTVTLLKEQK